MTTHVFRLMPLLLAASLTCIGCGNDEGFPWLDFLNDDSEYIVDDGYDYNFDDGYGYSTYNLTVDDGSINGRLGPV